MNAIIFADLFLMRANHLVDSFTFDLIGNAEYYTLEHFIIRLDDDDSS